MPLSMKALHTDYHITYKSCQLVWPEVWASCGHFYADSGLVYTAHYLNLKHCISFHVKFFVQNAAAFLSCVCTLLWVQPLWHDI